MVRLLKIDDVAAAFALSYDAGWNQTAADWQRLIELEPEGCFGIEVDGNLVATATLLRHDENLAWLGMVVTHPDFRRRGFARTLVEAAMNYATGLGISTIKLDASDQGRPLYEDLGFLPEQPVERWYGPAGNASIVSDLSQRMPNAEYRLPALRPQDSVLDRSAFGADRSRYLSALGNVQCFAGGFLMDRPGSRARYLGPCVANDPEEAARAIRAVVSVRPDEPWMWDLIPLNADAVQIARGLGFERVRQLTRMRYGNPIPDDDRRIYAISGFEAG